MRSAGYSAWLQRLAMGRAYVAPLVLPPRPVRKAPERSRVVAERLFEGATEAPQADEGEIAAASRFYSC